MQAEMHEVYVSCLALYFFVSPEADGMEQPQRRRRVPTPNSQGHAAPSAREVGRTRYNNFESKQWSLTSKKRENLVQNLKDKVKAALLPIYTSPEVLEMYKYYVEYGDGSFGEFLVEYSDILVYHPETIEELMEG